MISTKSIFNINEIPEAWVFEYYLNLTEKLEGQNIRLKSPFNSADTNPSCFIYTDENRYKFKDFSTGKGGSHIDLVMSLLNIEYHKAVNRIKNDYGQWILNNNKFERGSKPPDKIEFSDIIYRDWNNYDANYWLQYKIDSKTLNRFKVKPIRSYKVIKNGELFFEVNNREYIYGYLRLDGTAYRIYQPKNQKRKFLIIKNYIQGSDQLSYKKKYLGILSSLKDMMAFSKLWFNSVEVIAPSSENSIIPKDVISSYKYKYKGIFTLFDNDVAGRRGALLYEKEYGIKGPNLDMSKDLSDSLRDYSTREIMEKLTPLLRKALK